MEAKVTEKGVFDQSGKPVPIGTTIFVNGDMLPGYLVNKAVLLEDTKKRVAVTNPKKGATQPEDGGI